MNIRYPLYEGVYRILTYKDDVEENIFRPRLGECPF